MAKATNIGICQACGSTQKLPNGRLAKHGYTVDWGCFSGICPGSDELPYEQSCKLIESCVKRAVDDLSGLLLNIASLLKPATEPKGWFEEYESKIAYGVKRGYTWRQVTLVNINPNGDSCIPERRVIGYIASDGTTPRLPLYKSFSSLEEAATILNSQYVERRLRPNQVQLNNYIKWQIERISAWKLTELRPIPVEQPKQPRRTRNMRAADYRRKLAAR